MSQQPSDADKRKTLEKIVKGSHTALMVSRSTTGPLHGRPMAHAKVEDDLTAIWFATHRASGKTSELKENPEILLGYANSSGSEWASVNGMAELSDDRGRIKQLWSPMWKNWFDGPDDPNIELIRVVPQSAEYWDNGSRAIAMIKFAVGAVTGTKMETGENARVRM